MLGVDLHVISEKIKFFITWYYELKCKSGMLVRILFAGDYLLSAVATVMLANDPHGLSM